MTTQIETVELDNTAEYVPEWWENWPEIVPLDDDFLYPQSPVESSPIKQSKHRYQMIAVLAMFLAYVAYTEINHCNHWLANRPDNSDVDSESYSQDGMVCLRLGSHEYKFTPNIARAIADDFRKSADELEGSAE